MDRNSRDDACPGCKLFLAFRLVAALAPVRQPAASEAGGTCTAGGPLTGSRSTRANARASENRE
ncbi:MAG: hypothetical protein AB9879_01995 [Methanothrix sp.]